MICLATVLVSVLFSKTVQVLFPFLLNHDTHISIDKIVCAHDVMAAMHVGGVNKETAAILEE